MKIEAFGGALGAEITGVDLENLSDAEFAGIRQAWLDHKVIVVRDQDISKEAHLAFGERFGALEEVRTKKDDPDTKQYILYVANRIVDGSKGALPDGEMFFHADQCYYETPCQGTILNAIELPSQGGETLFLSTNAAYEDLSSDMKKRLDGLRAVNLYDYEQDPTRRNPVFNKEAPHFSHPIVTHHPETGLPALFVNRQMTHHVEGMSSEESEALLQSLFDHLEQDKYVYEHIWQPHDLLMWDNRAVLHARKDFDPAEARVLRRITVKGPKPSPYRIDAAA